MNQEYLALSHCSPTDINGVFVDPLRFSSRETLPFPIEAATRLGSERSKRYDDLFFKIDEAEMRFRELASIMGMLIIDDDTPTAA